MSGRKAAFFSCAALVVMLMLTGCAGSAIMPAGSEITTFEIVRVLGIDKSGDGVEVTVVAERAKPSPGEEGGGMSYVVMSAAGATAFEAVGKLREETDKRQPLGYADYIVFGEDTATEDFAKFADFPARSPEIRYSPKVFYVRGSSAKDLLSSANSADIYVGDAFDNLTKNAAFRSDFSILRNIELLDMLGKRYAAAIIPAIEGKAPDGDKLIGGEAPDKRLAPSGYAVLRDNKIVGWFDLDDARAYELLRGNACSRAYSITDGAGAYSGLELISADVRIEPRFDSDRLTGVTYRVSAQANIAERQQYPAQDTAELSVRLENAIEAELSKMIAKSQELEIDCLGLGDWLRLWRPYRWRGLESNWRESYKNLDITVKAEAKVMRSYDIR